MRSFITSILHGGHVARMGEVRNHTKFWSENLKRSDHMEELGIDGRIILEYILGM
jgi:hypothetical protein